LALAKKLAEDASNQVIVSARSEKPLKNLTASYERVSDIACDVTNKQDVARARELIEQRFGRLDVVILAAGCCEYFDLDEPDWDMMRRVMEVNYFGVVNSLELALPLLSRGAHVLVVSSMATLAPFPRAQAYGSSKAALNYFSDSLRVDLAEIGIDVTLVNPGFVDTPLTQKNDFPMPFLVSVDDAARVIVSKMKKRPREINFPFRLRALLKTLNYFPTVWFYFASRILTRS
jgi:short-subunit dehydrogenase